MTNKIYYNAPCGLYIGFLEDDMSRRRVLEDVLYFACYKEYLKHTDIKDEEKRFQRVLDILNCSGGIRMQIIERGKSLASLHSKEPYFSINKETYWDFHDHYKSDEECAMLMAYLALKSICGQRQWAKTNKAMWLSRADGKSRPEWKKEKGEKVLAVSNGLVKYRTNYGIRRLKSLLYEYYNVSFYSKSVHGFCFSTTMQLSELIAAIKHEPSETKRIDNKLREAIEKAEAAVAKAIVSENKEDTNELPF